MACYITSASSFDTLTCDVKELIPVPDIRRRMSRILRMGVATAMDALGQLPLGTPIDAIVTATGLGCIEDSEKFLANLIRSDEELLNPTPFIRSTFNTAGAQMGLLLGNHGCNMTYVHRGRSVESALLDAMIRIEHRGARHVLVTAFDEKTPTLEILMKRMGLLSRFTLTEGAWAFVLSSEPIGENPVELAALEFLSCDGEAIEAVQKHGFSKADILDGDFVEAGICDTAAARLLWRGVMSVRRRRRDTAIRYCFPDEKPVVILLRWP